MQYVASTMLLDYHNYIVVTHRSNSRCKSPSLGSWEFVSWLLVAILAMLWLVGQLLVT